MFEDSASLPQRPIRFLLRYVRRRPWQFLGLLLLIVAAAGCAVAVQYGMKLIVDAMSGDHRGSADVWSPLILFIGLIASENVCWRCAGWLGCNTIVATGVDVRLDLFDHLSAHSMKFFTDTFSGSLGNRITATAGGVGAILSGLTWNILPPCVDFIGAVIVLVTIDARMALALIAFVALVACVVARVAAHGRRLHQAYAEEGARVNGELIDVVSNIWTVKAFSARARERERLAHEFGGEAIAQRQSWLYLERTRVLHDLCLWLMAGGMLVWAVLGWRAGRLSAGDVVVISALTFRILHGSRDLAFALVGLSQQFGAIAQTLRVIARPHDVRDPADPAPARPTVGHITFDSVRYRYPNGSDVFGGLNLRIPAGQRVGIVGLSGAGKSTLLSLLQRLDDVQHGRILIDEVPLDAMPQDRLREQLAVVPQDIALFHRSVRENIRYGRPDASDDEVMLAAAAANCDGFIRKLPNGYDTLIGERGVRLSGGQRQRLSLARAFLKNAPILLLDEATSALDSETERDIQHALDRLMRNRTVLAVAHRLSTLSRFDRVIVLCDGCVVQDGTPQQLRNESGLFASLWEMQSAGFSPGVPDVQRQHATAEDAAVANA